MEIEVKGVEIDRGAVNPSLNVVLVIKYYPEIEGLVSITGKAKTRDNTIIGSLTELSVNSHNSITLSLLTLKGRSTIHQRQQLNHYHTHLTLPLTEKAISHLEKDREGSADKSVHLMFDLGIKFIEVPLNRENLLNGGSGDNSFLNITSRHFNQSCTIHQGDWVSKYAPFLGIGNFILFEFQIPEQQKVIEQWVDLYERMYLRTKEMKAAIQQGDWQKTMQVARLFYEVIKIGDNKPGHKPFEETLKTLFKNDQHSEEGIQNLLNGIHQFFEFTSKYAHDKDKKAHLKPVPVYSKEDAYFIYTICVGLLTLIGKKISK